MINQETLSRIDSFANYLDDKNMDKAADRVRLFKENLVVTEEWMSQNPIPGIGAFFDKIGACTVIAAFLSI